MTNVDQYEVVPMFNESWQKDKGLNNDSFVVVLSSTENKTKVYYYNPNEDTDSKLSFKSFQELVTDELQDIFYQKNKKPDIISKNNFMSISTSEIITEKDFNEDTKKTGNNYIFVAHNADLYSSGVNQENLLEKIKLGKESINDLVESLKESLREEQEINPTPKFKRK